jgi:hypothetical protein
MPGQIRGKEGAPEEPGLDMVGSKRYFTPRLFNRKVE